MASGSPSPSPSSSPSTSPEALTVTDTVTWWGEWITSGAPFRLAGIIVFAAVVNFLLDRLVRRLVARTERMDASKLHLFQRSTSPGAEDSVGLQQERRRQRAHAIGQLVRSVIAAAVWGTAILMVLPVLGIDITPLLASAGVIGVALGFGAQTLVKDYLSGIFMIVEDQFGVGDFVDLGSATGTVEEVTLRVTRLRDPQGIVWYVRNGEILRVGNRSQGWTLAVVDIAVPYDQDLSEVQHIVEAVAEELVSDPESGVSEFSRPTYAGIESVAGDGLTIRVVAKTDADHQVPLTREIRRRLKAAFDAAGITVPIVYRPPLGAPPGPGASGTATR